MPARGLAVTTVGEKARSVATRAALDFVDARSENPARLQLRAHDARQVDVRLGPLRCVDKLHAMRNFAERIDDFVADFKATAANVGTYRSNDVGRAGAK